MRLELIRSPIPTELIAALEKLLEEAREGRYTGFIIGLTRPRRRYSVHCVGEACDSPTWTRGILRVIDDELAGLDVGEDRDTQF